MSHKATPLTKKITTLTENTTPHTKKGEEEIWETYRASRWS